MTEREKELSELWMFLKSKYPSLNCAVVVLTSIEGGKVCQKTLSVLPDDVVEITK